MVRVININISLKYPNDVFSLNKLINTKLKQGDLSPSCVWRSSAVIAFREDSVDKDNEATVAAPLSSSALNYSCWSCFTAAGILKELKESDKDEADYTDNHISLWNCVITEHFLSHSTHSWLNTGWGREGCATFRLLMIKGSGNPTLALLKLLFFSLCKA